MVSTAIYNREEIKKNIERIFFYINEADYSMVKHYSDKLLVSLLKYYKTRGVSANHFYELFDKFNFDVLHSTDNAFKKQIVLDSFEEILKEIRTSTTDPLHRISEIYEDIRHLYANINKTTAQEIIDCFDELKQLKNEIEQKYPGPVYNLYTIMMQKAGNCESTILRIPQSGIRGDAVWNKLEDKFSEFFQAVHKVLAPTIRLPVDRSQIYELKKQGVPMEDMVEATGINEEELRIMLQEEDMMRRSERET